MKHILPTFRASFRILESYYFQIFPSLFNGTQSTNLLVFAELPPKSFRRMLPLTCPLIERIASLLPFIKKIALFALQPKMKKEKASIYTLNVQAGISLKNFTI